MSKNTKHVGKMKNNAARVAVVYRTLPGDPLSALVVGTNGLPDAYHDSLMSLLESDAGQQANELADVLSVRRFPDGDPMLSWLHTNGHLKKVPTNLVLMTQNAKSQVQLDELNVMIAEAKGVSLDELAITDGTQASKKKAPKSTSDEIVLPKDPETNTQPKSASDMRSLADKLFKEAQNLRKQADLLDPPKKKVKPVEA
jgi:hypothetical protein